MIKERRRTRRKFFNSQNIEIKTEFNKLTALIRKKIKEHKNKDSENFIQKLGHNRLSSRPFWKKINRFRNKQNIKKISPIEFDGETIEDDKIKCLKFGKILEEIFTENSDQSDKTSFKEVDPIPGPRS